MSENEVALNRCLRQLLTLGQKFGGYVTYQVIIDTLNDKMSDVSMEALDRVYEHLAAKGIEIVDELPGKQIIDACNQDNKEDNRECRQRVGITRPKRSYNYDYDSTISTGRTKTTLCLEDIIDKLIFRAETGRLRDQDFLTIVEECHPNALEVKQLIEYLLTKGINLPDISLSLFYNYIPEDREAIEEDF
ncbi:RNA polymerase sigma factor region1.1 domain-containing protein [Moorella sp. Hama-1]|uniref:RNA polymerase sigma factor region1.1 domain-containing protein n=1 Tax=Moorella sp. Hama-1 TaxID=2138101 RepID=UPI000D64F568|nr:RNA polymerase sigma factor region1.1 domain-containing protein [Moorella sp. Hama-1]BCV22809.1 hypothetical protein hamaS1_28780 [Moorella sp. Hama-1]